METDIFIYINRIAGYLHGFVASSSGCCFRNSGIFMFFWEPFVNRCLIFEIFRRPVCMCMEGRRQVWWHKSAIRWIQFVYFACTSESSWGQNISNDDRKGRRYKSKERSQNVKHLWQSPCIDDQNIECVPFWPIAEGAISVLWTSDESDAKFWAEIMLWISLRISNWRYTSNCRARMNRPCTRFEFLGETSLFCCRHHRIKLSIWSMFRFFELWFSGDFASTSWSFKFECCCCCTFCFVAILILLR